MNKDRFTIDGSSELEKSLSDTCQRILSEVQLLVPVNKLEALVLGGGYGRGEGGVLRAEAGDRPYNDLEFYVLIRGNRLLNEQVYRSRLHELGERRSPESGLHVEFKIDSLARLRHSPVSIFNYDLVSGHRIIFGDENPFVGCEHLLDSRAIPLSEASRLLFNRCSGLLLARELLKNAAESGNALSLDQKDFVGRNLAKAQLGLGDSVLASFGRYHWSCTERKRRLRELAPRESIPWLEEVRAHHSVGVEFKLLPRQISKSVAEFERERFALGALALEVWLWLENRRLGCSFRSAQDYAFHTHAKYPGTSPLRNYFSNLWRFGAKAALDQISLRYPRERLLNALSLLLWNGEIAKEPRTVRYLQHQLATDAADWTGFVAAYKKIWVNYG